MNRRRERPWLAMLIGLAGCATAVFLAAGEEVPVAEVVSPPLAVETLLVEPRHYQPQIPAWGVVAPAEIIDIRAEIPGKIVTVPPGLFAGAEVAQDDLLCRIDHRDYQNTFNEAQAMAEQARQSLEMEKGRQRIAKTEWELLEEANWQGDVNKALALREPQLKTQMAAVRVAEANLARATLDLERTQMRSPCPGVVLEERLAAGKVLDSGDEVAKIACTDRYHILAAYSSESPPVSETQNIPISIGDQRFTGMVQTLLPQIHLETRQRQALVTFQGEGVVLGAYADLALPGPLFQDLPVLPVEALRPGNTVWLLNGNGALEIRAVEILARDRRNMVVGDGLLDGEEVILSHIASPLQGMKLQKKTNALGRGRDSIGRLEADR